MCHQLPMGVAITRKKRRGRHSTRHVSYQSKWKQDQPGFWFIGFCRARTLRTMVKRFCDVPDSHQERRDHAAITRPIAMQGGRRMNQRLPTDRLRQDRRTPVVARRPPSRPRTSDRPSRAWRFHLCRRPHGREKPAAYRDLQRHPSRAWNSPCVSQVPTRFQGPLSSSACFRRTCLPPSWGRCCAAKASPRIRLQEPQEAIADPDQTAKRDS